jgi:hypothetical protein
MSKLKLKEEYLRHKVQAVPNPSHYRSHNEPVPPIPPGHFRGYWLLPLILLITTIPGLGLPHYLLLGCIARVAWGLFTSCSRQCRIDLFLCKILGLKKCYSVLYWRAAHTGILENCKGKLALRSRKSNKL